MQTCNGGVSHDGVLAKAPCTCQKTFLAFAPSPCSHGGEALHCIRRTRKINSERGGVWWEGRRQITKERGWEGKVGRSKESKRETMERRNRGRRRTTTQKKECLFIPRIAHFKCMNQHTPPFALDTKKLPLLSACAWQDEQPIFGMRPKGTRLAKSPVSFSFLPYIRTHTYTPTYTHIYMIYYVCVCFFPSLYTQQTHTHTHTYIYIYMVCYVCVCVVSCSGLRKDPLLLSLLCMAGKTIILFSLSLTLG